MGPPSTRTTSGQEKQAHHAEGDPFRGACGARATSGGGRSEATREIASVWCVAASYPLA
jgi:hypothetical protein